MRLALIQRRQNEQCNLVLIEIVPVRLTLLRITESRSIVFILHTCTSIEFEGHDTSCTSTSRLNIAVLWAYADHSYTRCLPGHCADISAICACFHSMIVSSGREPPRVRALSRPTACQRYISPEYTQLRSFVYVPASPYECPFCATNGRRGPKAL